MYQGVSNVLNIDHINFELLRRSKDHTETTKNKRSKCFFLLKSKTCLYISNEDLSVRILKESKPGLKPGLVLFLSLYHISGPCVIYPTVTEVARWLFTF